MALDGLVIHALTHELQALVGGRINKIHQPAAHTVIFHIRAQQSNQKLLISADPTYPRIHLTEQSFSNPLEPPMFCMILRKHCENGIIEKIEQLDTERIIVFHIKQRDELGDTKAKKIVVELMGRHSNIILTDHSLKHIFDGIHHVTPAISRHRIVMPGSEYAPPPHQNKANPLEADDSDFIDYRGLSDSQISERLVQQFSGISPLVANEIVYRSQRLNQPIQLIFLQLMERIRSHRYQSEIVETRERTAFSVIGLTHLSGSIQPFTSISRCLEAFYGEKAERDLVKQRAHDLIKFLQNERNKNSNKIEKLQRTLEKAKDAERLRILGELLTAALHQVNKGDRHAEVVNYYDPEQKIVVIPLDPTRTPAENAQLYFKRYNKSKNSRTVVQQQIHHANQEIEYLEGLLQQIQRASLTDIEEIREELIEQGYLRDRSSKRDKKKKKGLPELHCFISSEGIPIYVGKNNKQNEYLTHRLAKSSDTWLHTKDIPGSHVIIRSHAYGEATLEEAAQLAAYYSQARESSQVPVDYTEVRHVRKPSGAKPGFVIYDHQKTLYITPDEQRIQQLQLNIKA